MREAFEEWLTSQVLQDPHDACAVDAYLCRGSDGRYMSVKVQGMWLAWQHLNQSIAKKDVELFKLRKRYAGAIGLISTLSPYVHARYGEDSDDLKVLIADAARDWCQITGWSFRMVGPRLVLVAPELKG